MRNAFIKKLEELAEQDKDLILLSPDLGYKVLDDFKEKFPKQFLNTGVSEANTMGMAAGLAKDGKKVFVYSIIPFLTMRPYEQIRNDICYHNLNVKLVGVGAGYSYGDQGTTHHAVEDIGVMRIQPNMKVVCPGDPIEAGKATSALYLSDGPGYMRLGKAGEKILHREDLDFKLGKAIKMREGKDLTLIATGNMLETALEVADKMHREGLSSQVLSMHTVKPLDTEAIYKAADETSRIYTLEEHSKIGGLGSAVAEALTEYDGRIRHKMFGVKDQFFHISGTQQYLRGLNDLSPDQIYEAIKTDVAFVK